MFWSTKHLHLRRNLKYAASFATRVKQAESANAAKAFNDRLRNILAIDKPISTRLVDWSKFSDDFQRKSHQVLPALEPDVLVLLRNIVQDVKPHNLIGIISLANSSAPQNLYNSPEKLALVESLVKQLIELKLFDSKSASVRTSERTTMPKEWADLDVDKTIMEKASSYLHRIGADYSENRKAASLNKLLVQFYFEMISRPEISAHSFALVLNSAGRSGLRWSKVPRQFRETIAELVTAHAPRADVELSKRNCRNELQTSWRVLHGLNVFEYHGGSASSAALLAWITQYVAAIHKMTTYKNELLPADLVPGFLMASSAIDSLGWHSGNLPVEVVADWVATASVTLGRIHEGREVLFFMNRIVRMGVALTPEEHEKFYDVLTGAMNSLSDDALKDVLKGMWDLGMWWKDIPNGTKIALGHRVHTVASMNTKIACLFDLTRLGMNWTTDLRTIAPPDLLNLPNNHDRDTSRSNRLHGRHLLQIMNILREQNVRWNDGPEVDSQVASASSDDKPLIRLDPWMKARIMDAIKYENFHEYDTMAKGGETKAIWATVLSLGSMRVPWKQLVQHGCDRTVLRAIQHCVQSADLSRLPVLLQVVNNMGVSWGEFGPELASALSERSNMLLEEVTAPGRSRAFHSIMSSVSDLCFDTTDSCSTIPQLQQVLSYLLSHLVTAMMDARDGQPAETEPAADLQHLRQRRLFLLVLHVLPPSIRDAVLNSHPFFANVSGNAGGAALGMRLALQMTSTAGTPPPDPQITSWLEEFKPLVEMDLRKTADKFHAHTVEFQNEKFNNEVFYPPLVVMSTAGSNAPSVLLNIQFEGNTDSRADQIRTRLDQLVCLPGCKTLTVVVPTKASAAAESDEHTTLRQEEMKKIASSLSAQIAELL